MGIIRKVKCSIWSWLSILWAYRWTIESWSRFCPGSPSSRMRTEQISPANAVFKPLSDCCSCYD
ncbi:hypothetical protein FRX31_007054 [Thalictrum thalictroides]|uniref:Uncharacterized protein n=1 Tax=Thalictrum thalictroides TaxID=46969 RepID=A0A7J6X0V5_THATH|nr:hypothetical protein FRX31_007054 [Thalictrum thalictroides]